MGTRGKTITGYSLRHAPYRNFYMISSFFGDFPTCPKIFAETTYAVCFVSTVERQSTNSSIPLLAQGLSLWDRRCSETPTMGNRLAVSCGCMPHNCLAPLESDDRYLMNTDSMRNHSLLRSAQRGEVDEIKALLQQGARIETRRPFTIRSLPEHDAANIGGKRGTGFTPLMYAGS